MRRRRKRHDEIKVKAFKLVEFFERDWSVTRDVDADFIHGCDSEWIELAFLYPRRADIYACSKHLLEQTGGHRRTHSVHPAGKKDRVGTRLALAGGQALVNPSSAARRSK